MDMAVSFSVAMAWIAGGSRGELSDATRRGIFLFATVFLVVWLLFSWGHYPLFRASISIPGSGRDRAGAVRTPIGQAPAHRRRSRRRLPPPASPCTSSLAGGLPL